jgi:hypothetical protein
MNRPPPPKCPHCAGQLRTPQERATKTCWVCALTKQMKEAAAATDKMKPGG